MTMPYKPAQGPPEARLATSVEIGRPVDVVAQDAIQAATSASQSYAKSSGSALVSFFVPGKPAKKGSKNTMAYTAKDGSPGSYSYDADRGLPKWAKAVKLAATVAMREQHGTGVTPTIKPVAVRVVFLFARPKTHSIRFGRGRTPRAMPAATSHLLGDVDKLCRALFDPMTGVVFVDDAQVVQLDASKAYCEVNETPGARVVVLEVQT